MSTEENIQKQIAEQQRKLTLLQSLPEDKDIPARTMIRMFQKNSPSARWRWAVKLADDLWNVDWNQMRWDDLLRVHIIGYKDTTVEFVYPEDWKPLSEIEPPKPATLSAKCVFCQEDLYAEDDPELMWEEYPWVDGGERRDCSFFPEGNVNHVPDDENAKSILDVMVERRVLDIAEGIKDKETWIEWLTSSGMSHLQIAEAFFNRQADDQVFDELVNDRKEYE